MINESGNTHIEELKDKDPLQENANEGFSADIFDFLKVLIEMDLENKREGRFSVADSHPEIFAGQGKVK